MHSLLCFLIERKKIMGKDLNGKELGTGISQRKDGKYMGRYVDRFGDRKCTYAKTLKELKRQLDNLKVQDVMKISVKNNNITLDQWFKIWLETYKEDDIRVSTRYQYKQVYQSKISPTLGTIKLGDMKQLDIKRLLSKTKKDGFSFSVCNKMRIILVDMYNKAIDNDLVIKNPAKGLTLKRDDKTEPKVLSLEEQKDFFNCCSGTFYDNAYIVHVNTGLRPGELFGLKVEDIDWENNVIHVRRTLSYQKFEELGDTKKEFHLGDPKTDTSIRDIPINKRCSEALKKQIVQKKIISQKTSKDVQAEYKDFLFTTKFNTPLNAQIYTDSIKKIVDEINLTKYPIEYMEYFSGHTFRHTFATRCFEAGIQPKTVQKYLGHASLDMTMNLYTHVLNKYKTCQMDLLDEYSDELYDKMPQKLEKNKLVVLSKKLSNNDLENIN